MAGETELDKLLALMQPKLLEGDYVFCTVADGSYGDFTELNPLSSYQEEEGLSLLLAQQQADSAQLDYESVFKGITLSVHSSLDAVGFTAAVANKLAAHGIPANVVAAHFHDHVFVPAEKAELALKLLTEIESVS
ncbi:MAG: ACT domain-containing protein [Pseudomonadales bacterium]|nr:ACT domain-containing protein [Pseudomonadales bacterium]